MVSSSRKDFGEEMARMLPRLMRTVTRQDDPVMMKTNLTIPQMLLLEFLRESGDAPMSVISKMLNLSMSASTSVVDKMVKSGLLLRRRSQEDRRVVRVGLAAKGEKVANDLRESKVKLMNEVYSVLTQSERDQYIELLRKVHDNLED